MASQRKKNHSTISTTAGTPNSQPRKYFPMSISFEGELPDWQSAGAIAVPE